VEAGGVGIFSGIENTNLLIFRGAKNAKNDKIAANWNVSGTWTFQPLANLVRKISLLRQVRSFPQDLGFV
jgi:hypothetical protein